MSVTAQPSKPDAEHTDDSGISPENAVGVSSVIDGSTSPRSPTEPQPDSESTLRQRRSSTRSTSLPTAAEKPTGPAPRRDSHTGSQSERQSTAEANVEKGQRREEGTAEVSSVPLLRRPLREEEENGKWLKEEHMCSEWLSLFYDLAVVASLTTFSSDHDLGSPSNIIPFFSFYVILSWTWSQQTQYDVRFQGDDIYHRCMKFLQICTFVYMGGAAENWDLSNIRRPGSIDGISGRQKTAILEARSSFLVLGTAFAVSRFTLFVQYVILIFQAKAIGRKTKHQLLATISLSLSLISAIIAVAIPGNSDGQVDAKIIFFYVPVLVEVVFAAMLQLKGARFPVDSMAVAQRYGAFVLIILGEGIQNITKAFNKAVSGLSERQPSTYGQVILAVAIVYLSWAILFSTFRKDVQINEGRAVFWEIIHFALFWCLLLLFAAVTNLIIAVSFANTITRITDNATLTAADRHAIDHYLNRLNLQPTYDQEIAYLNSLVNAAEPPVDPALEATSYFGQIIAETANSYGVDLSETVSLALEKLYDVNTTYTINSTELDARYATAAELITLIIRDTYSDSLSGMLWLFPTAGGVLILAACRSLIWHSDPRADWHTNIAVIVTGVALALLGLLAIGEKVVNLDADSQTLNPMYRLYDARMPLVIVFVVYFFVHAGTEIWRGSRYWKWTYSWALPRRRNKTRR